MNHGKILEINNMITNDLIKSLNPCKDRFDNYLNYYKGKYHTKKQFMGLKNITHDDKLWVAFRLMDKNNMRLAVADIAESVLHIFEEEYPNDDRPRKAIKAARKGNKDAAVDAAHAADNAAANAAYAAVAAYAAYAASNAAYTAADVRAAYYTGAAIITAAAVHAVNAAANAAVASDRVKQEKLIRTIILKYWKDII